MPRHLPRPESRQQIAEAALKHSSLLSMLHACFIRESGHTREREGESHGNDAGLEAGSSPTALAALYYALNWSKKWPPVQEARDRISNVVEDLAWLAFRERKEVKSQMKPPFIWLTVSGDGVESADSSPDGQKHAMMRLSSIVIQRQGCFKSEPARLPLDGRASGLDQDQPVPIQTRPRPPSQWPVNEQQP
jgi:hypothetical protein